MESSPLCKIGGRKFTLCVLLVCLGTGLLLGNKLTSDQWMTLMQWLGIGYFGVNLGVKGVGKIP